MSFKGYTQIYTGDGKGKTTASIGLAIRAKGAGLEVAFFQFFKDGSSSEVKVLKDLGIYYQNFGMPGFVKGKIDEKLKSLIMEGWQKVKEVVTSKRFHVVVLDEFIYAINWNLVKLEEVLEFIKNKPEDVELVFTGRDAPQELVDSADLVTFMKKVKHYFEKNIPARKGIEK
ncbi:MAG: cob(I)yrinic acid a,c-diamide adenosyltransferase [Thermodesulfobacteria bacterium]|nr:cob(I)yrinic acid a,c-diamide adenosyltransferase [Thermodesulfobacteriota bacterium]